MEGRKKPIYIYIYIYIYIGKLMGSSDDAVAKGPGKSDFVSFVSL